MGTLLLHYLIFIGFMGKFNQYRNDQKVVQHIEYKSNNVERIREYYRKMEHSSDESRRSRIYDHMDQQEQEEYDRKQKLFQKKQYEKYKKASISEEETTILKG